MTQDEEFKAWWYSEGSQAPYTHHDCEEHTMRMCEIAWANGAYKEREALAQPKQEPVAYINVEERKLEWAKPMNWNTPTVVKLERIPLYTKDGTPVSKNHDGWRAEINVNVQKINLGTYPTKEEASIAYVAAKLFNEKKHWIGLTRIELIKCKVLPYGMSYEIYQAIEAKLKEKNCAG